MNKSSHTTTIFVIIAIILLAVAYFFFMGNSSQPSTGGVLVTDTSASDVGQNELGLLNQIRPLHIDTSFFVSPVYEVLKNHDISVDVPAVHFGRSNPFTPLLGSQAPAQAQAQATAPASVSAPTTPFLP